MWKGRSPRIEGVRKRVIEQVHQGTGVHVRKAFEATGKVRGVVVSSENTAKPGIE